MSTEDNTIQLYVHDGLVSYDTEGGRMCCPPYVQTPQDCVTYFGGRPIEFIRDPHVKDMPPDQIRKAAARARELRELVNRERAEERRRISEARRIQAREQAAKISHTDMRYTSGNWKGHVAQYTLAGKLVGTYRSAREAARKIGVGLTSITYACRDKGRSSSGYQWRWYSGDTPADRIGKFIDGRRLKAQAQAHLKARRQSKKEVA